ncbi:MAG TPA: SDR family NAD(P)-dependent oxidoreductase [Anaerolineales bacterium]
MNHGATLITGGAGFIGCNLADTLLENGDRVLVFDNLSRKGSQANLEWLQSRHGRAFNFIEGDVRDFTSLSQAMQGVQVVYHLAAQTAVTRSVEFPWEDFDINARGTLNVLEAARLQPEHPVVFYSSTNKVYGALEGARVLDDGTRYSLPDYPIGIDETYPVDFHSPYGCSKGAADQYMHDYARIYGIPTVVFRQSCIYGQRQFGVEDQGWVAWFVIASILGYPITIYGDGKQIRDILNVKDLVRAYILATEAIDRTAGQIYNIGGGPANALSIWAEFGSLLCDLLGNDLRPEKIGDWRPGDQPVFISNTTKARQDFGWEPLIPVRQGVADLMEWVCMNKGMIASTLAMG